MTSSHPPQSPTDGTPPRAFFLRTLLPLNLLMAAIAAALLAMDPWVRKALPLGVPGGLILFLGVATLFNLICLALLRAHGRDLEALPDLGEARWKTLNREQAKKAALMAGVAAALSGVLSGGLHLPPHLYCLVALPLLVSVLVLLEWKHNQVEGQLVRQRDRALQARLAPHFILSALSALKGLIPEDPQEAMATSDRMARLFREALELSRETSIPLGRELAFVEAYLGLEKARFGARLEVSMDIPEDLEAFPVPPLSLQVLVENAVVHGVGSRPEGGKVRIQARRTPEGLSLEVEDSGSGRSPVSDGVVDGLGPGTTWGRTSSREGSGQSLSILRQRLARPEDLTLEPLGTGGHRATLRLRMP